MKLGFHCTFNESFNSIPSSTHARTHPLLMKNPKNPIDDNQSTLPEPQQQHLVDLMTLQQAPDESQPNFLKSIEDLSNLSTAILNFKRKFDDLNSHFQFIGNALDAKFNQLPPQHQQLIQTPIPIATPSKRQLDSQDPKKQKEIESEREPPLKGMSLALSIGGGRGLRKYLVDNLGEISKLREQVPAFLKRVRDPARVVLDCVGKFYSQGVRAYAQGCPLVQVRQASVLMLELFLPCIGECSAEIKSVKEEADGRAITWKKRMVDEGGVSKASEIDARGLLLFVACFGIPKLFSDQDVGDLITVSNLREIQHVVRQSHVLLARIKGIIEKKVKNKMNLEAADMAYIFGVEKEISLQKILTSFLENLKQKAKGAKGASGYPHLLYLSQKKQLADLKSVKKFIEDRKLDPAKVIPGWQIKETITSLEKEIAELDKKMKDQTNLKRMRSQNESSSQLKTQELKRPRFTTNSLPYSPTAGFQEQKAVSRSIYNYTAPLTSYGSGGGSLPENYPSAGRSVIDIHNAGLIPRLSSRYGDTAVSSYAQVYGDMLYNKTGQTVNNSATLNLQHRDVDASYENRLAGLSFSRQSEPSFPGLLNSQSIGTSSDLYRFADTVVDSEFHNSSSVYKADAAPPCSSTYRSSYFYP